MASRLSGSSPESRANERSSRLLRQKAGPDALMVGVLVIALILGLLGLAVHVLWIVAIIVMALGLGFAAANRRRDRIDVVNQRADRRDENLTTSATEETQPTTTHSR